jgi:butyrate kinase
LAEPIILVINPGSTSTRTALYQGLTLLADQELVCRPEQIAACARIIDQIDFRTEQVREFLAGSCKKVADCAAIAARGGPLRPVHGGVYRVNQAMLDDARSDQFIEHVSKLACIIGDQLGRADGVPCFVVDPVSTDEMAGISRISGLKDLPRKGLTHALNLKRIARQYAAKLGRPYETLNLITAHLGGGTSIAVHAGGRMIDSVDANGDGPFSPERSGGLRADSLVKLVAASGKGFAAIRKMLTTQGGLVSHLGTGDSREVENRAQEGDANARLVYEALAYNVAKHICALAAAVNGKVDGVLLTGGLARSRMIVDWIRGRVEFLAPVEVYPGEHEMAALREGAARALTGEEPVRIYPTGETECAPT